MSSLPAAALESPGQWIVKRGDGDYVRVLETEGKLSARPGDFRHFATTDLATLRTASSQYTPVTDLERQVLFAVYEEVVATWHKLGDTRFTLLGLLPAVSIIAWAELVSKQYLRTMPGAVAGVVIGALALISVAGISMYHKRNDELYDDLISRGRKIEEELGIATGLFIGRRGPQRDGRNHGNAVGRIYFATAAGWILVTLLFAY